MQALPFDLDVVEMDSHPKIELLQAEVDENDESYFRLLVDGRTIKYITIGPGIYSTEDMCFGPSLVSILPELPPGDWNDGLVARDADDRPHFASAQHTQFPGVQNTWHGTYIEYMDLLIGRKLRTGIYEVRCASEVLSRLHALGIRHGDINRFNFLVQDSKATLIDFDTARKCDDRKVLLQELEGLPASLEDLSYRGGGGLL
ncbi:hypothetical protein ATERTT37_001058 [Aspergillus terreus]